MMRVVILMSDMATCIGLDTDFSVLGSCNAENFAVANSCAVAPLKAFSIQSPAIPKLLCLTIINMY